MLCLKCEANSGWIKAVLKNIDEVIIDHAHCEKKAAGTGMSLLSSYPDKTELTLAMADLVEEEIGHFKSVVQILQSKNITLSKDKGDEYVKALLSYARTTEPNRLLDRLLIAGIVEARSCERLQLIASAVEDSELRKFYSELSNSEAGHYVAFIKLAKIYFDETIVRARLDELTEIEKSIVQSLPNLPAMHG
ncbi:MAG: tRNA-(ms[2]io[6]A)-hydroxylase [Ignavibacteriaceae bacterium]|nr:tRNA-(ms[2]io[6]A)-hydroxylase [Ignavibacteriaceae bacterium]